MWWSLRSSIYFITLEKSVGYALQRKKAAEGKPHSMFNVGPSMFDVPNSMATS
jgi:hypothetical protein